ncbi:hypothetical protein L7F22_051911 [Adiantum nelumboides]|nr:hypothetical protein [Adiantum nelumboides]
MTTMVADERGLLLSIVLPIPDQSCKSSCCEKAWQDEETANDNDKVPYRRSCTAKSDELETSQCTEEEKVAVEQLAELRRIRDLSMQEDVDDCSCSTESSFNTYEKVVTPSLTSSHTSHTCDLARSSPAASTSAACIVDIWNLKHKLHVQPKHVLQLQSNPETEGDLEENLGTWAVTTYRPFTHPSSVLPDDVDNDDDGRRIPRSRLLSDLYQHQSSDLQPRKANKRRRKFMSVGHSHGDMNDDWCTEN